MGKPTARPVTNCLAYMETVCNRPGLLLYTLRDFGGEPDTERIEAAIMHLRSLSLGLIEPLHDSLYLFPPDVQRFIRETAELCDGVIASCESLLNRAQKGEAIRPGLEELKSRRPECERMRLRGARLFLNHLGRDRFVGAPRGWRRARREFDRGLEKELRELDQGTGGPLE